MRTRRLATSVLLGALAVAGCGRKEPGGSGGGSLEISSDGPWAHDTDFRPEDVKIGGQVVLAMLSDPDSLNPYLSTSADTNDLLHQVFPRLMEEAPDFAKGPPEFHPYLAESWKQSEDERKITFKLRPDAYWSDGVPITAEDVRFSWATAKDKDVAWSGNSIKDFITNVVVVDPKTVTLEYSEVYPYQLMDANDGDIVPAHVFGKIPYADWKTKGSWTAEAGVGGGPYRVVEYVSQQQVVLEANPRYWRKGFPRIPKIVVRVIKDQDGMRDAFLSGGTDVLYTARPQDVKRYQETGRYRFFKHASRAFTYVGWNCERAPTDDRDVRRAFTLAINRADLVESLYYGFAKVGVSPIIRAFWAHDPSLEPWPYDPEEAKRLLDSKGWKPGPDGVRTKDGRRLALTATTNAGNQMRVQALTRIQANLREVGADVKIEQVEHTTWVERLRTHDVDAWYGGWNVATKIDEKPTWHSASRGRDGFNWGSYVNPRVDEIIDQARVMTDFDAAKPLWREFERIVHEDQPYTFVAEPMQLNFYRREIRNVKSTAAPGPYANLEEWWLEGGVAPPR
jgi:peptide/nickel transport system substrate-binding protein